MNQEENSLHAKSLDEASHLSYDVLIIGGGIVGTGIARDASMRGLSVALFERNDFSSGTSSKSSRLIHGGLRYLDTFDFKLVFKDLHEREKLVHIAPHLIHPLGFIIPNYSQSRLRKLKLWAGMVLYDMLSWGKSLPSYQVLKKGQVQKMEPALSAKELDGGFLFYDCQAPFVERLSIENVLSASKHNAMIFNHTDVIGYRKDKGEISGLIVRDLISGESCEFRSKLIVNSSGPWADQTLRMEGGKQSEENLLRTTKGIHFTIPKITEHALVLYARSDGRLFFVIPWFDYSLVGTTDTDYADDPSNAHANSDELQYLLRELEQIVPGISSENVEFAYAGVRPLVSSRSNKNLSAVSRNYRIVDHSSELQGLISVLGVKLTSYRAASQDVVDLISKKIGKSNACSTDKRPLPGGEGFDEIQLSIQKQKEQILKKYGLDSGQIEHLLNLYGSRTRAIFELLDNDQSLGRRICERNPDIVAQIVLAVNAEFALSVNDFMLRRTPLAFSECQGMDCAAKVGEIMGRLIGWSDVRIHAEVANYEQVINSQYSVDIPKKPMQVID